MTLPNRPDKGPRPPWRPWAVLVLLLLLSQSALLWLSFSYERANAQGRLEQLAGAAASDVRRFLQQDLELLQHVHYDLAPDQGFTVSARRVLREHREILRIEQRAAGTLALAATLNSLYDARSSQSGLTREEQQREALAACGAAEHLVSPRISDSYFLMSAEQLGAEVVDFCVPPPRDNPAAGYLVATVALGAVLEIAVQPAVQRGYAVRLLSDGARLAAIGPPVRMRSPQAEHPLDMAGFSANVQLQGLQGPRRFPDPATVLVFGLSVALAGVVLMLIRDVRRRARVEHELSGALALRSAIDNSLITGLRARDMQGRITYVNPAFCRMVGYEAAELIDRIEPPYWPVDRREEYATRQGARLAQPVEPPPPPFETEFQRKNGERFPAQVHEAPLLDVAGRQTGWLSAIIDLTAQRRSETLLRQQQDKLQSSARMAMLGEMASLLSHELNQPLAAIVGYASGTLNMLDDSAGLDPQELCQMSRHAVHRIVEQGERAGRVIKSVHDLVRQRQTLRECCSVQHLLDAVLPLVRLQAQKSGVRLVLEAPAVPLYVTCDATMIEQVVLNLARNALQSIEVNPSSARERVLRMRVGRLEDGYVEVAVVDSGGGISAEIEQRLFTPFFSTRADGLGLGLSMCRTAVEQHGGRLQFRNVRDAQDAVCGAEFLFTLPEGRAGAPPKETPP